MDFTKQQLRHCGDRKIYFVVPAYNEEASIGDLIDKIIKTCRESSLLFEIIIVDDGSHDKTGEISKSKGQTWPVQVIRNEPNKGLGFTIRRGLKTASSKAGLNDILITLDADLTQDPSYVPSMLAVINKGADVVIASRYRKGSHVEGLSLTRLIMSYGASAFVALLRPIRGIRDYSCGFRAYRSSVIHWAFETFGDGFISEKGFGCMVEIAQKLRGHANFSEVPFVLRYDAKRKESALKILPTIWAYIRVLKRVQFDVNSNKK